MFECHKIKIYDISNATIKVPQLSFNIKGLHIDEVYEFNFLGLITDEKSELESTFKCN